MLHLLKNRKYLNIVLFMLLLQSLSFAKEPKTIITGDQMEIIHSGEKVIFTGNSKVVRGNSVLNADQLVQDKKNNQVDALGKVKFTTFTKDKELVKGQAEKAKYNTETGQGELFEGRPEIKYYVKSSTSPLHVQADIISFDEKTEEIRARGNVVIISSSTSAYCSFAVFTQKNNTVVLTGAGAGEKTQPYVIYFRNGEKSQYKADIITAYIQTNKVKLEGNVHGILVGKELDKKNRI